MNFAQRRVVLADPVPRLIRWSDCRHRNRFLRRYLHCNRCSGDIDDDSDGGEDSHSSGSTRDWVSQGGKFVGEGERRR